jgi:hypothetical protein
MHLIPPVDPELPRVSEKLICPSLGRLLQCPAPYVLEDPMLELRSLLIRTGVILSMVASAICGLIFLVRVYNEEPVPWAIFILLALLCWQIWALIIPNLCFMPNKRTGIYYLRSFRNDSSTWMLRVRLQEAFGPGHRLSGIRDPRRRRVGFIEQHFPALIAMKYCTPKFMDMEAGKDWQARLYNALIIANCAVIDVREPTEFVHVEVKMSLETLGLNRMLFVVDDRKSDEAWRAEVAAISPDGTTDPSTIHLAFWNESKEGRHRLVQCVNVIKSSQPKPRSEELKKFQPRPVSSVRRHRAQDFFVSFLVAQGALLIFALIAGAMKLEAVAFYIVGGMWMVYYVYNWIIYIRDVGIYYERKRASVGLAVVLMPLVVLLLTNFIDSGSLPFGAIALVLILWFYAEL